MKILLLLLIGESFRTGRQGTRVRGQVSSHEEQILALESQKDFIL